jgi:hypothetical protein
VGDFSFEALRTFAAQNRPLMWLHDEEEVWVTIIAWQCSALIRAVLPELD